MARLNRVPVVAKVQRDIAFSFTGVGNGSTIICDNTVNVDPTRCFALPRSFGPASSGMCSNPAGPYPYGGSVWVQSASVLRGTMRGTSSGRTDSYTLYADLYTLATRPKSLQVVTASSSPLTINPVDLSRVIVLPVFWYSYIDAGAVRMTFNSPSQVAFNTVSSNLVWVLLEP